MKVKLIRVIREEDNNGSVEILAKYFKDVELLQTPQRGMRIRLDNVEFFIDYIVQDLNTQTIILYNYKDIYYRYNRNGERFKQEREILSDDGWQLYN